jgi:hypothetical protein
MFPGSEIGRFFGLAACLGLLATAGPAAASESAAAPGGGSAVVLSYLRVGEDAYPAINLRTDQFDQQLSMLRRPGIGVVPLEALAAALQKPAALEPGTVGLSIDDAYRSTLEYALPRLVQARLPVTVFASMDRLDRGGEFATWDELRQLTGRGVTIGARLSVAAGPDADEAQIAAELNRIAGRFREQLGQAPTLLALPVGPTHPALPRLLAERGFTAAFGLQSGPVHAGSDRWALPRFAMTEAVGDSDRFAVVLGSLPLPVLDQVPLDGVLHRGEAIGFSLADGVGGGEQLACFGAGLGRIPLERPAPARIELRPAEPFAPGLVRINCTLPAADGHWRWLGLVVLIAP